ncbi:acyl-CoA carboxylase subunit epsilon [Streptomyces sp. N2-109]|uniref:Acyl-CoA carboxylase subunit epsilon n=1 Tax=Streptomyces gossypii TaxID=2883101 RepID=A0ABT2JY67_9ACTN|nr:acyl-CoA carboxylase epsilon subunit [Streptomyces gossypii]MCT2592623.1 acyl-CoA carboxylase subunit epsilon [Streptomyces gossypii]
MTPTTPIAPSAPAAPTTANLVRLERGQADAEELAALTAVLLARAAAHSRTAPSARQSRAAWRRLERQHGFSTAHSWQH